jgi:hypothetical protein
MVAAATTDLERTRERQRTARELAQIDRKIELLKAQIRAYARLLEKKQEVLVSLEQQRYQITGCQDFSAEG